MATGILQRPRRIGAPLLLAIVLGLLVVGGAITYYHWASTRFGGHYPFDTRIFGVGTSDRYASLHLINYDPADWSTLPAEAAAQGMRWSVWAPSSGGRALLLDTGKDAAARAWFIIIPLP